MLVTRNLVTNDVSRTNDGTSGTDEILRRPLGLAVASAQAGSASREFISFGDTSAAVLDGVSGEFDEVWSIKHRSRRDECELLRDSLGAKSQDIESSLELAGFKLEYG